MQKMASDPTAPAEMRELGKVLFAIMTGDLNVKLDALPNDVAAMIRGLIGRVRNK